MQKQKPSKPLMVVPINSHLLCCKCRKTLIYPNIKHHWGRASRHLSCCDLCSTFLNPWGSVLGFHTVFVNYLFLLISWTLLSVYFTPASFSTFLALTNDQLIEIRRHFPLLSPVVHLGLVFIWFSRTQLVPRSKPEQLLPRGTHKSFCRSWDEFVYVFPTGLRIFPVRISINQ